MAKEYVRRNPSLGLAVDPVIVVGNRTDAKAFLENGKKIDACNYLLVKLMFGNFGQGWRTFGGWVTRRPGRPPDVK